MRAATRVAVIGASAVILAAGTQAGAATLTMGGTGIAIGIAHALGDAFSAGNPAVTVEVPPSVGSGGGIRAVAGGQFGLGFSARPLKDDERDQGLEAIPLCRTPLVLAVSEEVTGDLALTGADLVAIYTHGTSAWPDGTPITPLFRPQSETAAAMLEERFPALSEAFHTGRSQRGAIVAYSDQEMMDIGERITGSLVFGALAAIRAEGRRLQPLRLDGVTPSLASLADGTYPLAFTLWMVVGPAPADTVQQFTKFAATDEAAAILRTVVCLPFEKDGAQQPGEIVPPSDSEEDGQRVAHMGGKR